MTLCASDGAQIPPRACATVTLCIWLPQPVPYRISAALWPLHATASSCSHRLITVCSSSWPSAPWSDMHSVSSNMAYAGPLQHVPRSNPPPAEATRCSRARAPLHPVCPHRPNVALLRRFTQPSAHVWHQSDPSHDVLKTSMSSSRAALHRPSLALSMPLAPVFMAPRHRAHRQPCGWMPLVCLQCLRHHLS